MGALLGGGALLLGALPAQQSNDAVKRNRGHSTDPLVHLIRLSVMNEERSSSCIHQMLRAYALKKSQTWLHVIASKIDSIVFQAEPEGGRENYQHHGSKERAPFPASTEAHERQIDTMDRREQAGKLCIGGLPKRIGAVHSVVEDEARQPLR
ncbi:hypothetical protein J2X88_002450 [Pseudomonas extremaustralis]|nr:hypothetical protein [Pseudomonas extremaustralis]